MTAMQELCIAARFEGDVPDSLSYASVSAILDWTHCEIDFCGRLWRLGEDRPIPLTHGKTLRAQVGTRQRDGFLAPGTKRARRPLTRQR